MTPGLLLLWRCGTKYMGGAASLRLLCLKSLTRPTISRSSAGVPRDIRLPTACTAKAELPGKLFVDDGDPGRILRIGSE